MPPERNPVMVHPSGAAGGDGAEHELPLDDDFDVGALDAEGNLIRRERRHLPAGESTITLTMPRRPVLSGIDPLNMLISHDIDADLARVDER